MSMRLKRAVSRAGSGRTATSLTLCVVSRRLGRVGLSLFALCMFGPASATEVSERPWGAYRPPGVQQSAPQPRSGYLGRYNPWDMQFESGRARKGRDTERLPQCSQTPPVESQWQPKEWKRRTEREPGALPSTEYPFLPASPLGLLLAPHGVGQIPAYSREAEVPTREWRGRGRAE